MSNRKRKTKDQLKKEGDGAVKAYVDAVHKEMEEGQPYPGASVEDRDRLAEMEASMVYDQEIMSRRCNR